MEEKKDSPNKIISLNKEYKDKSLREILDLCKKKRIESLATKEKNDSIQSL